MPLRGWTLRGGDHRPCPEDHGDEEFFSAPDAASMEEAINKFMEGLEASIYMQVYGANVLLYPGISASLETTLCLLCSFVTPRSCGVLIFSLFSTVKGSPWSPPLGLRQCEKDCRIALPQWWQTP